MFYVSGKSEAVLFIDYHTAIEPQLNTYPLDLYTWYQAVHRHPQASLELIRSVGISFVPQIRDLRQTECLTHSLIITVDWPIASSPVHQQFRKVAYPFLSFLDILSIVLSMILLSVNRTVLGITSVSYTHLDVYKRQV